MYDEFYKDLNAADVFERVRSMNDQDSTVRVHIKDFLCVVLTEQNVADVKSHVSLEVIMALLMHWHVVGLVPRFHTVFKIYSGRQQ